RFLNGALRIMKTGTHIRSFSATGTVLLSRFATWIAPATGLLLAGLLWSQTAAAQSTPVQSPPAQSTTVQSSTVQSPTAQSVTAARPESPPEQRQTKIQAAP